MRPLAHVVSIALAALAIAGCATGEEVPPPATSATPCASSTDVDGPTVSPRDLCDADGVPWRVSPFVAIVEVPAETVVSQACDDTRVAAGWGAWLPARDVAVTLEPGVGGSVAVAVLSDGDGRSGASAAEAVAAIEAHVEACIVGGMAAASQHDGWHGIEERDGHVRQQSWWVLVDDRWAMVQARQSVDVSAADAAELDDRVATVLDVQRAALEA